MSFFFHSFSPPRLCFFFSHASSAPPLSWTEKFCFCPKSKCENLRNVGNVSLFFVEVEASFLNPHEREREIIFQTRNTSLFKTFDYAAVLGFSWAPWQITFHWKIQKINDRVAKVTPVPFAFRSGRKIVLVLQLAALGE